MNEIFKKYDSPVRGGVLLPYLIEIRGHQCECCKNTEWLEKPINLQVHHIDGDRTNNELDNLQLLCLNCHSYTDNFGSKNNKHLKTVTEEEFVNALKAAPSIRQALLALKLSDASGNYVRAKLLVKKYGIVFDKKKTQTQTKIHYCKKCGVKILPASEHCVSCGHLIRRLCERPSREELKQLIRTKPFTQIAQQYGVSDNAIRRWCDAENLPRKKSDINTYSDEEWNLI